MSDVTSAGTENRKMAEQIYDKIMGDIEPDLLLRNIPGLDEKYKGESDDERKARMKKYKEAYKRFDKALAEFMWKVKSETRQSKQQALRKKEREDRDVEAGELAHLESAFSSSCSSA